MPASCGSSRARIIPSTITASPQVWFILKGEFTIDGRLCPPGTMLYHPDPHFEGAFHTATGGEILIVQYPGPSTGERPIYAGRFNMEKRKAVEEERVDLCRVTPCATQVWVKLAMPTSPCVRVPQQLHEYHRVHGLCRCAQR